MNFINKKSIFLPLICLFGFLLAGNAFAIFGDNSGSLIEGMTDTDRAAVEKAVESASPATEGTGFTPPPPQTPNIEIPIPGFIGFSEVKVEGGTITIPWIGEYFAAIFNWLMAIVGGVATVMVMIGGFIYVTAAGDQGRIGKAKEMINNALIGLFLAVGSYLILYTINPDLVSFKSIRLDIIKRQDIGFTDSAPDDSGDIPPPAPGSVPTTITSTSEDCSRVAELVRNNQIPVNRPSDKAGLENNGILRRTACKWCYEDSDMAPDAVGTAPRTQSACHGESLDVQINPRICTLLLRLYEAKQSSAFTGHFGVGQIIGSHSRCSKRTADTDRCHRCITTSIAAGPGGNGWGQSDHWRGNGIDLPPNESMHRYIAENLTGLGIAKLYGPYGWTYSMITCPDSYNNSRRNPRLKPVNFSGDIRQGTVSSADARYVFHRPGVPADAKALCGHLDHIHISFGE